MSEKPWRVIQPSGMAWRIAFKTEHAAWHRVLVLIFHRPANQKDTPENRALAYEKGWRLRNHSEVTSETQETGK